MKAAFVLVLSLALAGAVCAAGPPATPAAPAAQDAQNAGELGPQKEVIPQVSIPLKRRIPAATGIVPAPGVDPGVDDRAARCLAKETAKERMACEGEPVRAAPRAAARTPAAGSKASAPAR